MTFVTEQFKRSCCDLSYVRRLCTFTCENMKFKYFSISPVMRGKAKIASINSLKYGHLSSCMCCYGRMEVDGKMQATTLLRGQMSFGLQNTVWLLTIFCFIIIIIYIKYKILPPSQNTIQFSSSRYIIFLYESRHMHICRSRYIVNSIYAPKKPKWIVIWGGESTFQDNYTNYVQILITNT
jgi:hypothetical protein